MCVVGAHSPTVCSWVRRFAERPIERHRRLSQPCLSAPERRSRRREPIARRVVLEGFDKHYRLFRATSARGQGALRGRRLGGGCSGRSRNGSASTTSASASASTALARRVRRRVARATRRGGRRSSPTSGCSSSTASRSSPRRSSTRCSRGSCRASYYRQRPDLRARGDLDRVHRVRPADLPLLLPGRRTVCANASSRSSATSAGTGRSPTSSATSTSCSARSTSSPGGLDAPRAEPPDPGAELRLLPQQGRLRGRQDRQRPRRAALRRPRPARRDGRLVLDAILLDAGAAQRPLLALARLLHGRHGGAVRLRRVPAAR